MNENPLAPVALFVYNRLANTQRTLSALLANTLAADTDLYVFSDGAADEKNQALVAELRNYLHTFRHEVLSKNWLKSMHIIERPENYYLERNVIEGINEVFVHHDTIIVLEDDIVTAPHFLSYMNKAFALYRKATRVMHITGFTHLDLLPEHAHLLSPESETYFTPHASGWGWGTWRDRWQQHFRHYQSEAEALAQLTPDQQEAIQYGGNFPCLRGLKQHPISWDLCWEIAVRSANGLALHPAQTLVRNIGLSNGTHFGRNVRLFQRYIYDREPRLQPLKMAPIPLIVHPEIETEFAHTIKDWGIRYTLLGRIVRWIYHALKGKKS